MRLLRNQKSKVKSNNAWSSDTDYSRTSDSRMAANSDDNFQKQEHCRDRSEHAGHRPAIKNLIMSLLTATSIGIGAMITMQVIISSSNDFGSKEQERPREPELPDHTAAATSG